MGIKDKILQMDSPAAHSRRSFMTVGKVTKSNEKINTCSVQYSNSQGYTSNKENVQVQLYSPGFHNWFPKVDEVVTLNISESYIKIIGPANSAYSKTRADYSLKKDILSSNFGGTLAGNIF